MAITSYKNIRQSDFDSTVWRYLSFPKYISLLTYGALWFSKLNILTDRYEGAMPRIADAEMLAEHQKLKDILHPTLHEQIESMNTRNVQDGRELIVVNCWFASENESDKMWKEYAGGTEGVAIKSTVGLLSQCVFCDPRLAMIGRVQYVDLNSHSMSLFEANQAHERAFLKTLEFCHEQEVRIATMNIKGPMCVNMDGTMLNPEQYQGANMNNFENPGLYIRADLRRLIKSTVLAPGASRWFELLVKRIVHLSGLDCSVERSMLERQQISPSASLVTIE
jgi:hypothetical protein